MNKSITEGMKRRKQIIEYAIKEKKAIKVTREGEQVQVDIKYILLKCIGFKSEVDRYYQITGIDVYTRKRILKIVKEKSTYETSNYLNILERSHREDSEKFYANRRFKSEEEMYKRFERYAKRQNNIAKKVLKFKTANEMLEDYIEKEKARVWFRNFFNNMIYNNQNYIIGFVSKMFDFFTNIIIVAYNKKLCFWKYTNNSKIRNYFICINVYE